MPPVEAVFESQCLLGETPLWHQGQQALYWSNIMAGEVHRFTPRSGEHRCWTHGFLGSGLAETRQPEQLLVVSQEGLLTLNTQTGDWCKVGETPWPFDSMMRPNEARVDPQGRLWLASMHMNESDFAGQLFSLSGDKATLALEPLCIPNTLVWSPDSRYLYFADSKLQTMWRYPFEAGEGNLGAPEPFFSIKGQTGSIDGSAIDRDGCLWTCLWGQGRLVRLSPEGEVLREIPLPVLNPTSCCFGGPDMTTLYITSARKNVTARQLAQYPLSGSVLSLQTDVAGMLVPPLAFDPVSR